MNKLQKIYKILYNTYGPQGWWPINGKYRKNNYAGNNKEQFEIAVGAILTQYINTGY